MRRKKAKSSPGRKAANKRYIRALRLEVLEPRMVLALHPLSDLPLLSSNPSAAAKIFLDFDGHTESSWLNFNHTMVNGVSTPGIITPAFDQDGDRTTFSDSEETSIREIWSRVAEDYAPFNVDVTTIDPAIANPSAPTLRKVEALV